MNSPSKPIYLNINILNFNNFNILYFMIKTFQGIKNELPAKTNVFKY